MLLRVEIARFTRTKSARLCSSNPRLAAERRYLLHRPMESGLSSEVFLPCDRPTDFAQDTLETFCFFCNRFVNK